VYTKLEIDFMED